MPKITTSKVSEVNIYGLIRYIAKVDGSWYRVTKFHRILCEGKELKLHLKKFWSSVSEHGHPAESIVNNRICIKATVRSDLMSDMVKETEWPLFDFELSMVNMTFDVDIDNSEAYNKHGFSLSNEDEEEF
jgi:hypothetical protein